MSWEENLKQRVEADQFGDLSVDEKHEILALIESLNGWKKIAKRLEDKLARMCIPN